MSHHIRSAFGRLRELVYPFSNSHPVEGPVSRPVATTYGVSLSQQRLQLMSIWKDKGGGYPEAGELRKRPRGDSHTSPSLEEHRKRPRIGERNNDNTSDELVDMHTKISPDEQRPLPFLDMEGAQHTIQSQVTQSELFPTAHDFVIKDSVFFSHHSGRETNELTLLFESGVAEAWLHSSARHPPPRCHPDTRQELRARLFSWLRGPHRPSNLFWLYGLAGVGKSAVAQTVTESSSKIGFIASTYFFSPNWDNPNRVVPSFAHQLAAACPVYRNAVTQVLGRDRSVLTSALHIQFQRLIVEPLLQPHTNRLPQTPILFVLDGLDECQREDSRKEFIRLIDSFAVTCHRSGFPFLWLVTSRSEWHIDLTFSTISCIKEELSIDSPAAQRDVATFLRDGFGDIRTQFSYAFEPGLVWPSEEAVSSLLSYASGLPIFAATVLSFVGDERAGDPIGQLSYCLAFLKGNVMLDSPLLKLDFLYGSILRTIPDNILPTTMLILGFHIRNKSLSVVSMCQLFSLREVTFNMYMCRLRSVMDISTHNKTTQSSLRIYHSSFEDFLRRSLASGEFGVNEVDIITKSRTICMQWYTEWKARGVLSDYEGHQETKLMTLSPDDVSGFEYAKEELWKIWTNTPTQDMSQVYTEIREFDFGDVERRNFRACLILLGRLSSWYEKEGRTDGYNVLRSEPECMTDRDLLEEYSMLLKYSRLKKGKRRDIEPLDSRSFLILTQGGLQPNHTAFRQLQTALSDPCASYFLIGNDSNTCIGLVYRDNIKAEQYFSEAFEEIRGTYSIVSTDGSVSWPRPSDLKQLVSFIGTSDMNFQDPPCLGRTIVAFVRDPFYGNPVDRLNWMLDVVKQPFVQSLEPRKRSQYLTALLIQRLLSQIPSNERLIAERVLAFIVAPATGTSVDLRSRPFSAEDISRVLGIDKKIVLETVRRLSPLLSRYPVSFKAESGLDFDDLIWLMTPSNEESGWGLSRRLLDLIGPLVWGDLSITFVNEFNQALEGGSRANEEVEGPIHPMPNHSNTSQQLLSKHQMSFLAQSGIWVVLSQVTEASARVMAKALQNLRFSRLDVRNISSSQNTNLDVGQFLQFVNCFYVLQLKLGLEDIIRLDRNCDTDDRLLERWSQTGISYRKAKFPVSTPNISHRYAQLGKLFKLVSLHFDPKWDFTDASEKWSIFFLGQGENSCLIALCDTYA